MNTEPINQNMYHNNLHLKFHESRQKISSANAVCLTGNETSGKQSLKEWAETSHQTL